MRTARILPLPSPRDKASAGLAIAAGKVSDSNDQRCPGLAVTCESKTPQLCSTQQPSIHRYAVPGNKTARTRATPGNPSRGRYFNRQRDAWRLGISFTV